MIVIEDDEIKQLIKEYVYEFRACAIVGCVILAFYLVTVFSVSGTLTIASFYSSITLLVLGILFSYAFFLFIRGKILEKDSPVTVTIVTEVRRRIPCKVSRELKPWKRVLDRV